MADVDGHDVVVVDSPVVDAKIGEEVVCCVGDGEGPSICLGGG